MTKKTSISQNDDNECKGTLRVCLRDSESHSPIQGASVSVFKCESYDSTYNRSGVYRPLTIEPQVTGQNGCVEFELPGGDKHLYSVAFKNALGFQQKQGDSDYGQNDPFYIECNCTTQKLFEVPVNLSQEILLCGPQDQIKACQDIQAGRPALIRVSHNAALGKLALRFSASQGGISQSRRYLDNIDSVRNYDASLNTAGMEGPYSIESILDHGDGSRIAASSTGTATKDTTNFDGRTITTLTRTETSFTEDVAFWAGIRNSTEALSFNTYLHFMDYIFCGGDLPTPTQGFEANRFNAKDSEYRKLINKRVLPFTDSDAYRVVKAATEAFVMVNCGNLLPVLDNTGATVLTFQPFNMDPGPKGDNAYLDRRDIPGPPNSDLRSSFNGFYLEKTQGNGMILPYLAVIRKKLPDIPIKFGAFEDAIPGNKMDNCFGLLQEKLENPCLLELIWSYWHEEGMLVQSMSAITRRFQNVRSSAQDPLANLEMDPLRPLNNLFWGYIQDEQHRLTVGRRNYEYDHHYGLRLEGKAVQNFRPVDTRSKFLEAFHHLLRLCTVFYKQDDDTTVKADAFPVLNALKEVHLILSQGAHNQFGDLPSTARIEMLMQQWLLARPEFREFLPTRIMVAYPEPWMDRVDAMKKLQGWTDTSVLHFRNLGMFGEQLLLSIRWGHWSDEFEPVKALNWARFFRPQAQGYIHAYRAATGVDLSADPTVNAQVDSTLPSVLLQKRLATQQRAG